MISVYIFGMKDKIIKACVAFSLSASPLIAGGTINVFNMSPNVDVPHHVAIEAFRNNIEELNAVCENSEEFKDGGAVTAMCAKLAVIVNQSIPCFDVFDETTSGNNLGKSQWFSGVIQKAYDMCELEGAKILSSGLHTVFMDYVFDERRDNSECEWDKNSQCYKIVDPTDNYAAKIFVFDKPLPA